MKLAILCFLASALVTEVSIAQSEDFKKYSKWCYAASNTLADEGGQYRVLRDHIAENVLAGFGISKTEAKIEGENALAQAAQLQGVTVDKMALDFFNKVCKPIFVR